IHEWIARSRTLRKPASSSAQRSASSEPAEPSTPTTTVGPPFERPFSFMPFLSAVRGEPRRRDVAPSRVHARLPACPPAVVVVRQPRRRALPRRTTVAGCFVGVSPLRRRLRLALPSLRPLWPRPPRAVGRGRPTLR